MRKHCMQSKSNMEWLLLFRHVVVIRTVPTGRKGSGSEFFKGIQFQVHFQRLFPSHFQFCVAKYT